MSFSRTLPGIIARCLFYPKIIVHVEGPSDIPFYEQVLRGYNCHVESRDGRKECEKLADALAQGNYPYVVVLDGDYEILVDTQSKHRRVILLHRFSFENYLFEEEAIKRFCRYRRPRANLERLVSQFRAVVADIESKFKELIVLDVAHQCSKTGYSVLPDSPVQFFETQGRVNFREGEIQRLCEEGILCIDKRSIKDAGVLVDKFLKEHRLIDLLPGHFAFGIIRRLIVQTVKRKIADDDIKVSLSTDVWDLAKTRDHDCLKEQLHCAVEEAKKMPRPGKGIRR